MPADAILTDTQSEDDRPLVLLHHLDRVEEGEGEGGDDHEDGGDGEQVGTNPGTLLARCNIVYVKDRFITSFHQANIVTSYLDTERAACWLVPVSVKTVLFPDATGIDSLHDS